MNVINMPGFAAEAALYKTSQSYRASTTGIAEIRSYVTPQLPIPEFPPDPGPVCRQCRKECRSVSCGPDCVTERCEWICVSIPC